MPPTPKNDRPGALCGRDAARGGACAGWDAGGGCDEVWECEKEQARESV